MLLINNVRMNHGPDKTDNPTFTNSYSHSVFPPTWSLTPLKIDLPSDPL